jgi:hypothetical protein
MPARGVEIVTGTTSTVYVRAEDGRVYGCKHIGGIQEPKNCWYEAKEPATGAPAPPPPFPGREAPEPPDGTVVDREQASVWYAESISEVHYVLMQDGRVYKWEYDVGMYGSLFKIACGPTIGLVVAVAAVAFLWIRHRRRRARAEGQDDP